MRIEDSKEVSLEEKHDGYAEDLGHQDVEVCPGLAILQILVPRAGPRVFRFRL